MNIGRWLMVIAIIIVFAGAVWGVYALYQKRVGGKTPEFSLMLPSFVPSVVPPLTVKMASPTPRAVATPSGFAQLPKPSGSVLAKQPETGIGDEDQNNQIIIYKPSGDLAITSPLMVSGWTRLTGETLRFKVLDQRGIELGGKEINTCTNDNICRIETNLDFTAPQASSGFFEIWRVTDGAWELVQSSVVQF